MLLNGVTLLSRRAHLLNALVTTKVRHVNPRSAISDDALRSATFGRLHLIGRSIPARHRGQGTSLGNSNPA
jgi:hypothetical protein